MAEKEKVTTMVLKVDLQCHKCYKKVKKVLCKFPQIRDQVYDEKQNHVVIKVVCCSPEKVRDRICSKGGGAIKSIEIKEPEKPKTTPEKPPKVEEKPKSADKPTEPEKTPKVAEKPKQAEKPKEAEKPKPASEKPKEAEKPNPAPAPDKPKEAPPKAAVAPVPVGYPPPYPLTVNGCYMDCYHGHHGGPCPSGYGGIAPYIQYDGYYGRPVYDSYGGGRSYSSNYGVARADCFSEENPQGCTVM